MTAPMTTGRARRLDTLANEHGVFCVLALDHRDSMRAVMPDADDAALTEFKLDLIRAVGVRASGVMLEPELSLPQAIDSGALTGQSGFMAALESQGYTQDPWAGSTELLAGWSAAQALAMGASAAKLLLPYDPDRVDHAADQQDVVRSIVPVCHELDLPLLVEPVAFGMDPADRPRKVRESAAALTTTGLDVLKLEFPGNPDDPDGWSAACAAVDEVCTVPWVLLSSGVSFEQYRAQLTVAFDNGCSGFTGGRAIWRPASDAASDRRSDAIANQVVPQFDELRQLAIERARPWRART